MTKRIAIFFLTCVLAAGCCLPALAEEAAPAPVSGPTPETTSSNTDNTVETFPENNTDSNISGKSTPAYYPYQIATVPDGRQTLIVMRYRVPEGTTGALHPLGRHRDAGRRHHGRERGRANF